MTNNIPIEIRDYALELEAEMKKIFRVNAFTAKSHPMSKSDTYSFVLGGGIVLAYSNYYDEDNAKCVISIKYYSFNIKTLFLDNFDSAPANVAKNIRTQINNMLAVYIDNISNKIKQEYNIYRIDSTDGRDSRTTKTRRAQTASFIKRETSNSIKIYKALKKVFL